MSKGRLILMVCLFTLGWTLMYADRNILGPVLGTVGTEWGLNKSQLGLLSTVFFAGYAALQIPSGIIADKFGRVKVLVIGMLVFGVGVFFSGIVGGFTAFLVVRLITGIGEATYYGTQYAISSSVIPTKIRGLSSAIINSGMALGVALGLMSSSYFTYTAGKQWQFPFTLLAIPAIVLAIVIGFVVKDKSPDTDSTTVDPNAPKASVKMLFSRNHILTYVVIFCSLYGFFGMLTWLPLYLQQVRGLAASQTGFIASLVPLASIPGAIFFGYISDKMKDKKKLVISLAFAAAICQVMIPYVGNYSLMIVGLVLYGLIGKLALDPVLISYVGSITPKVVYAKGFAFFNFAGVLSSVFAPTVNGWLAEVTGTLTSGFYLSAILIILGGISFSFTTKIDDPNATLITGDTKVA
ncbi:MFS transporter [Ammoniphilus oxalaticus]|uniref:MFS transporter n=1 Tax=Ammoniphilus oxalaticus TaxID=66863 RepID=A0A419SGC2_9BACL|nr:MFS transporter [Ammoniphilus oxalaticus]RKD22841.1 MFS transporter [Ammoniphilus oxalaticus]